MAAADQETHASGVRPRSYQDESYLHGFLGNVDDLQKNGVLQDVVLEVEGRRFPCHRLVLSAASPYFRAMFTSDMAESRQKTVVLQGLEMRVFEEILSYIYSGTLHVSLDKVQPLYHAADLLQLDYVRDTCSSYMAMNVERSTCVDLYKFADVFSMDNVRKACLRGIARHFTEVASSEEFNSLSVNQLTEIICHDELDVKEETTVWEAVVRWVQHSRENRLHHLPSILPYVRFSLLTSDDKAGILEHPLVREDPGISKVIRTEVRKENPDLKSRLGMTTEMVLMYNPTWRHHDIFLMNPREEKYINCSYSEEDIPRFTDITVTSDNDILVLETKEAANDHQLSLFRYNNKQNMWEQVGVSLISKEHYDFKFLKELLVEVDQTLYYLAVDQNGGRPLLQTRKYNQQARQWLECSPLQFDKTINKRGSFFALSCGSHIYFFTSETLHSYDPSQDQWSKRTPPIDIAKVCTAVAMGTEIFCTDRNFTQTMVYDTESDCWQKLPGWPNPGNFVVDHHPSLLVLENQLHILLTCTVDLQEGIVYLLYVYDRSADAWIDLKANVPDDIRCVAYGPCCPVARIYLPYLTY
ncbi:kelch repeat and BTB domain-containing protein 2-like isoform X1 [Branchiostoma floridae]|uniref:Kelch repeat and BTB domain-containing protein 2-like isoform X1 n=1 Tax=Branchiostoma floridae TaxID=7739 RepID=A0A9J7LRH2_BRAFL|nr:kelch repeat and BTB domain-containing protein 2-like isoform X1 [Branchiostoma floridae]